MCVCVFACVSRCVLAQRPKTSRRVPQPSPDQFADYVLPSPDAAATEAPSTVEVVSFEGAASDVTAAVADGSRAAEDTPGK